MSEIPADLKYLASHEWARLNDDGTVTIGITDHAQEALGDVVYVELPEVGNQVTAGREAGVVESVKAASDVFSLVSGEVIAVNDALVDAPDLINQSPFVDGWFFRVQPTDVTELDDTLDADGYADIIEEA